VAPIKRIPVVEGVFEDVLKGHSSVTEDVDEQGFDFSLGVMENDKPESQSRILNILARDL